MAARFSNIRDGAGRRIVGDMELLAQTKDAPTMTEQERLQLKPGDSVLRTTRLRRYNGQPFMHEEVALAVGRFPGLEGEDTGIYRISALAQRHGIHLAKASELVALEEAAPQIAKRLGVKARTQLLKLDRVIYAAGGLPVEWRVALCSLTGDMLYFADIV